MTDAWDPKVEGLVADTLVLHTCGVVQRFANRWAWSCRCGVSPEAPSRSQDEAVDLAAAHQAREVMLAMTAMTALRQLAPEQIERLRLRLIDEIDQIITELGRPG